MRKMTKVERSFFRALLIMQVVIVLTGGFGIPSVAVSGLVIFLILDLALVFTRAKELLATTPRRFGLIAVCVVAPVLSGVVLIQHCGFPYPGMENPNTSLHGSTESRASASSSAP